MKFLPEMCPRCGLPVKRILVREIRGRRYVYAVHYIEREGKKVKKQCYLGPVDHYKYVTKLHEDVGLLLVGAWKTDRVIDYLEELLNIIRYSISEIPPERREILKHLLEELLELLS